MPYSNITSLLKKGRELQQLEHQSKEAEKLGTLRAGSSGIRSPQGDVAGACHRKTMLRSLGIQIEVPDDSKQMMFELGFASEDIVCETLGRVLQPGHVILREADIPTDWTTRNGIRVTGRPDVVICSGRFDPEVAVHSVSPGTPGVNEKLTPILGIELKSVHSVWSAKKYLFGQMPSLSNLAQAGHYMWKLDIPYKLIYKSYSALGQGMSWAPRMAGMFPAQGQPMSSYMNYNENGNPLEVKQFEMGYSLEFDQHGRLKFLSDLPNSKWVPTLITKQDLEEYYQYISTMAEKKELGGRPMTLDAIGEKESYTMCKYCPLGPKSEKNTSPFAGICDSYEDKGFDRWLQEVKKVQVGSEIK